VYNLKRRYNELLKEHNDAIFKIEELKKNINLSKMNEAKIEVETYLDEIKRLKELCENKRDANINIENNE